MTVLQFTISVYYSLCHYYHYYNVFLVLHSSKAKLAMHDNILNDFNVGILNSIGLESDDAKVTMISHTSIQLCANILSERLHLEILSGHLDRSLDLRVPVHT